MKPMNLALLWLVASRWRRGGGVFKTAICKGANDFDKWAVLERPSSKFRGFLEVPVKWELVVDILLDPVPASVVATSERKLVVALPWQTPEATW
jgi:hypothetical protein